MGSIPGLGRSSGGGNGNLLQYSCLENPMDRGACQPTVHGFAESDMIQLLNNNNRGTRRPLFLKMALSWTMLELWRELNPTFKGEEALGSKG